ncbi:MAG: hypothetical protein AAF098_11600 [Pseudomonadota bacterium]
MRYDSDWMYHGLSETFGRPALGLALDWQSDTRWFAGVETHRMFDDSNAPRPWATMIYVGAGGKIGENGFLTGSVQRRNFPTSNIPWDFTEFEIEYDHQLTAQDRLRISADYSSDYYSLDTSAFAAEINYSRNLGDRLFVHAHLGAVNLADQSMLPSYQYGGVGGGLRFKRIIFDVSLNVTSESDARRVGLETFSEPRLVSRIIWRIY